MNENGFEVFDKYHSRSVKELFVTIQRRGNFSLNRAAFQTMGSPSFVELLFNRSQRLIGFRSADSQNGRAVPIRKQANSDSYMIAGLTFTKEYDIDTSVARRFNAKMEGNMLLVDLNSVSTDATGPRLRSEALLTTRENLVTHLDQTTNSPEIASEASVVSSDSSLKISEVFKTTEENINNVLMNALMQLDKDQKRRIAEVLLREISLSSEQE